MVNFPGGKIYRVNPSRIEETLNKDEEMIYKLGNTKFPKIASWTEPNSRNNFGEYKTYHGKIYLTNMRIIFEGEKSSGYPGNYKYLDKIIIINLEQIVQFKYSIAAQSVYLRNANKWKGEWVTKKGQEILYCISPYGPELLIEKHNEKSEKFTLPKTTPAIIEKLENIRKNIVDKMTSDAKDREIALDYDAAIQIWENLGEMKQATRIRKLKAEQFKVDQTVVHGDYVDDRDTIIKDSVLNRTNVGASGEDKFAKLKELKEMFDSGFISKEEMEEMKKEILGK